MSHVKRLTPPLSSIAFLILVCVIALLDWVFPASNGGNSERLWPHLLKGTFVLLLAGYLLTHVRTVFGSLLTGAPVIWFAVLFLRFISFGDYQLSTIAYMSYHAYWVVIFLVCAELAASGRLNARQLSLTGAVMSILTILVLVTYNIAGTIWLPSAADPGIIQSQMTNSVSYQLLWFSLMLLLPSRRIITVPLLVLNVLALAYTAKRGAIAALIIGSCTYATAYLLVKCTRGRLLRFQFVAVVFGGLCACFAYLFQDRLAERWSDIADPQHAGSGRLVFWSLAFGHWYSANLSTKMFGFGPRAIYEYLQSAWLAAIPAHNDWINLIHDFGLSGVVPYAIVWVLFAASILRIAKSERELCPLYSCAIAAGFCVTMYSLFCYNNDTAWFSLTTGYIVGRARYTQRAAGVASEPAASFVCSVSVETKARAEV